MTNEPTTGEMISALKKCREMTSCEECICFQKRISDRVYLCDHDILTDRLESQERTIAEKEASNDRLATAVAELTMKVGELTARAESAERERDALINSIERLRTKKIGLCSICEFEDLIACCHKDHCDGYQLFKRRGLQPQDGGKA